MNIPPPSYTMKTVHSDPDKEATDTMPIENLTILNPKGKCLARPGISLSFYMDETLSQLAPKVIGILDRYVALIGEQTLQSFINDDGYAKKLTKRTLTQDRVRLQSVPDTINAIIIEYSSDPAGWISEFGFTFNGANLSHYLYEENRANYLRLDFPLHYLTQVEPESLLNLFRDTVSLLPVQFANGGFAFQRSSSTQSDSNGSVNKLLMRYLGFDPGYEDIVDDMRGHTFTAHWLNYLRADLVEACGGKEIFNQKLASAELHPLPDGIVVRSAKYPPVGDVNRGATDLGQIPELAKLMQPVRADINAFGEPVEVFDAAAWMARFDERSSYPWDNEAGYNAFVS